jgi:hypothetical protein
MHILDFAYPLLNAVWFQSADFKAFLAALRWQNRPRITYELKCSATVAADAASARPVVASRQAKQQWRAHFMSNRPSGPKTVHVSAHWRTVNRRSILVREHWRRPPRRRRGARFSLAA